MGSLVCLQAQDEFTAAEIPEQAPHTSTGPTHSRVGLRWHLHPALKK